MQTLTQDKVDDIVDEAASTACECLDKYFPGFDDGGINSNFIGELKNFIQSNLEKHKLIISEE